jgi:hypothetical protein
MTDEQINAAIAEACGLKKPCRKVKLNDKGFFVTQHAKLPNYCTDLNAMHEAEKVLTDEQYMHFSDCLYDAEYERRNQTKKWRWLSTTARQRAEAFLRTLFLWKTDHSGESTEMEVQK